MTVKGIIVHIFLLITVWNAAEVDMLTVWLAFDLYFIEFLQ